jgi:hypothetical protein
MKIIASIEGNTDQTGPLEQAYLLLHVGVTTSLAFETNVRGDCTRKGRAQASGGNLPSKTLCRNP